MWPHQTSIEVSHLLQLDRFGWRWSLQRLTFRDRLTNQDGSFELHTYRPWRVINEQFPAPNDLLQFNSIYWLPKLSIEDYYLAPRILGSSIVWTFMCNQSYLCFVNLDLKSLFGSPDQTSRTWTCLTSSWSEPRCSQLCSFTWASLRWYAFESTFSAHPAANRLLSFIFFSKLN